MSVSPSNGRRPTSLPSFSCTLQEAGAAKLMTPELIATLADHAQGNPRALMNIAAELLDAAAQREARHIDEKLFLEMCAAPSPEARPARRRAAAR